jgi:predicted alpha/beta superfamily hydrolase
MERVLIDGKACRIFGTDSPGCLLIQLAERNELPRLEAEADRIASLTAVPFALAAVEVENWLVDLMPWPDGNISRDPEAGRHGQEMLDYILLSLVPVLEKRFGILPVILGAYSLGALFALWASAQTDRFSAIAAASPSVWIRDWIPFARKHVPLADDVYLSLGDREELVKNQAIARVGDCLRTQYSLLQEQLGVSHCTLVWEHGNHFSDSEGRVARAFAWCADRSGAIAMSPR